jgi:predicted acylesterase/phospholipase RssA
MNTNNITVPKIQRAVVLQGGGALAAYQVGALKKLIENLKKKNADKDGPLFDIVAGTSMGAMNVAVLVGNVINRNKTWEEAAGELEKFWTAENGLSSKLEINKWWWKDDGNIQNMAYASPEAMRKYYSVKEFLAHGTPRVCTPCQ